MESYIPISKINDFTFCPVCAYLHFVYQPFNQKTYHQIPQVVGKIKHETVDKKTYTTAKQCILGMDVYSHQYGLCGKIDMYDTKTKKLTERKASIQKIYPGYRYQMYAQYLCMTEMGYEVASMGFYSMSDNKTHPLPLPGDGEKKEFESVLNKIKQFDATAVKRHACDKCVNSIYAPLAW